MRGIQRTALADWLARFSVGLVFVVNVSCAAVFLLWPERYAGGFEVSGVPGKMVVQGFGILFLMWNATYPPVIVSPWSHRTLFAVILAQQLIGLVGESWMWLGLPDGHAALRATGLRFIVFDGAGLLLMASSYLYLVYARSSQVNPGIGEQDV